MTDLSRSPINEESFEMGTLTTMDERGEYDSPVGRHAHLRRQPFVQQQQQRQPSHSSINNLPLDPPQVAPPAPPKQHKIGQLQQQQQHHAHQPGQLQRHRVAEAARCASSAMVPVLVNQQRQQPEFESDSSGTAPEPATVEAMVRENTDTAPEPAASSSLTNTNTAPASGRFSSASSLCSQLCGTLCAVSFKVRPYKLWGTVISLMIVSVLLAVGGYEVALQYSTDGNDSGPLIFPAAVTDPAQPLDHDAQMDRAKAVLHSGIKAVGSWLKRHNTSISSTDSLAGETQEQVMVAKGLGALMLSDQV